MIKDFIGLLILLWVCTFQKSNAQAVPFLKQQIAVLAGPGMDGRGYIKNGHGKAADYIVSQFKNFGLRPFETHNYQQPFFISANTFPSQIQLEVNGNALRPGVDFLVGAASSSFEKEKFKFKKISFKKVRDTSDCKRVLRKLKPQKFAYIVRNTDSFFKNSGWSKRDLIPRLPKGLFVLPQKTKLIWTVKTDTVSATTVYLKENLIQKKWKKGSARILNKFELHIKVNNVIGYVKGTKYPDSFIVFSAHYDHLGKMGTNAEFPGASDNASGTAALLYLAKYYSEHPQPYSVAFMAFAAEEAGLLGSEHYVQYPFFPLENIKWLTNLDIMGDATDGISVVNGKEFTAYMDLLTHINATKGYLPKLVPGGPAANSDHYFFYKNKVPCIFIFTRGGPGFYHDVYDKPRSLKLTNLNETMNLIIDFTSAIQQNE